MASSVAKTESTTQVKCNPQKFYELIKCSLHHLPAIYPEVYTDGKVLEGDGESEGSRRMWKYILPGTTEELVVKARTTKQDDKNMLIVLFVDEGSVHDHHTHFVVTVQVTPKGSEATSVTWTIEYKKKGAESPDPHHYLEVFNNLNEKVAAHLNAKK